MRSRKLIVEIAGDTRSLEESFRRAGLQSRTFGESVRRSAGIASIALGGGLAVAAKIGFSELAESSKVSAQTEAALKSTGKAAHVTAGQIDELADSTLRKTGIDDEATKSAENMLLTFTNVRNEVGKNNDIFNQATNAVADLATRMNNGAIPSAEQLSTTAIRVGKALQDPIKGVTALRRVGVLFTRDQEKQIKSLVETGKTMDAQKLILHELNREFGGSAEAAGRTLPGKLAITREEFKNMSAQLTEALLPAMTKLIEIALGVTEFLQKHRTLAKALVVGLAALAGVLGTVAVGTKLFAAAQVIATAATAAWTAAQWLLNVALTANPIGIIIVGLAALTAALILAWKNSATFRRIITGAFNAATASVQGFIVLLKATVAVADKYGKAIARAIAAPINAVIDALNAIKLPSVGFSIKGHGVHTPGIDPIPDIPRIDIGAGGTTVVHTTVNLDGQKVAQNTTKHQTRRNRTTAVQRSGRNAGVGLLGH